MKRVHFFFFLPFRIMIAADVLYMAFITLRYVPYMPTSWRFFNHKLMLNFVKNTFSAPIEVIIQFLSFNLLIWCITLIDVRILKNPCIP